MSALRSNLPAEGEDIQARCVLCASRLGSLGRLLVAYSGGVDSGFLAWVAHRELGNGMMAVLADSPSLARSQMRDATAFAEEQGMPLTIIDTRDGAS